MWGSLARGFLPGLINWGAKKLANSSWGSKISSVLNSPVIKSLG